MHILNPLALSSPLHMSSPAATDALTLHMLSPVAVDALTRRVNEQQTASPVTPFIGIAAFANIPTATKGDDNATNGDDNATNGYDSDDTSMPNAATPDVSVPRAAAEKRPMPDEHDASPSHKVVVRTAHEGEAKENIGSLEQANYNLKEALVVSHIQLTNLQHILQNASFFLSLSLAHCRELEASLVRHLVVSGQPCASSVPQAEVRDQSAEVARLTQDNVSLQQTRDRLKQRLQSAVSIIGRLEDTNTTLLQVARQLTEEEL
ncbi:hypothetical protein C8F04DRAFT_1255771 [Mycena alexandri]|uniref:Uncharacterized protein n=1 Tax=Mycena alexandri TaxID=1745969 RepID=A0AAD6T377_9AGAR|nr:hypothetical protein C8F04DRAFT_1255771 [Mycena alexandri]